MINFLLKLIGEKRIIKYLIDNIKVNDIPEAPSETVWKNVYRLTPELKKWLKNRELQLLKSQILRDKPNEFILGQIFENKIYQRFDVENVAEQQKEVYREEIKIPLEEEFLKKWNKK